MRSGPMSKPWAEADGADRAHIVALDAPASAAAKARRVMKGMDMGVLLGRGAAAASPAGRAMQGPTT